jgi:predicted enzyme related to lactoylglutathione lyase
MGTPNGKVTWFEITTNDMTTARTFCEGVFGWQLEGDPDVYRTVPPAAEGGMPGGQMPARGVPTYASFGVEIDDVDHSCDRALELGPTADVPPTDNPGGVRSAYLRDPDGSPFSISRFGPPVGAGS